MVVHEGIKETITKVKHKQSIFDLFCCDISIILFAKKMGGGRACKTKDLAGFA